MVHLRSKLIKFYMHSSTWQTPSIIITPMVILIYVEYFPYQYLLGGISVALFKKLSLNYNPKSHLSHFFSTQAEHVRSGPWTNVDCSTIVGYLCGSLE